MKVVRFLLLGVLAGAAGPALAAAPPEGRDPVRDAWALAGRIDRQLSAAWAAAGVVPARPATDEEFVRRVYLDLAGRIPSVAEVRAFLADRRADKRRRLVEKLLDGPRYVSHFVQVWRALLLPEADSSFQLRFQVPGFENWLRGQMLRNAGYDQMVRELLTVPLDGRGGRFFLANGTVAGNPQAFYAAKEFAPENLAGATGRLFMGVNVECAQCHHHPFADWKREQFWSFAAFFAGMERRRVGDFTAFSREVPERHELAIPGTEKVVQARFLDGKEPKWRSKASGRAVLAEWLTRADNPFFARAAANRLWAHFFGTGLIDPVDEMVGTSHSASHPAVLDELAREFAAHKFDIKFLLRTITATRAYGLSSARSHKSQDDPRHFARMPLRGLTADQLYDSIAQATGYQEAGGPRRGFGPFNNTARTQFLTRFRNGTDRPTEVQTSILQALTLMNGGLVSSATTLASSETLAAVCDAPFLDTAGRIEALYLAALSRKPRQKELLRLTKYVEAGSGPRDRDPEQRYQDALADVFWALLNSGEFMLNH
jgi:hypothetical protein